MDMWINLWNNSVAAKPQLCRCMKVAPQDIVYTSEIVPYAAIAFGAECFEILYRVRVGHTEFGDPVHERHHNFINGQSVFCHVGQREGLAQGQHVIPRRIKRDLRLSGSDLRRKIAETQPRGVRLLVYQHLVQHYFLPGGQIARRQWRCKNCKRAERQLLRNASINPALSISERPLISSSCARS